MRIFYYAQVDMSGESGSIGSVRHVVEVVNRLSDMGHELVVFVPETDSLPDDFSPDRVNYFRSPPGFLGFLTSVIACVIQMILEAFRHPPDVIYSREMLYTAHTSVFGKLLRTPTVMEVNGFQPEELRTDPEFDDRYYPFLIIAEGLNYWLSDQLIVVSSQTERKLRDFYALPDSRTTVIQNGVNTDRCRPMETEECRNELGYSDDGLWAGFLGYLFPWSGVEYIIKASPAVIEQHPDAMFMIIGGGSWGDHLPKMADDVGVRDHFIFTGEIPWTEVPKHLNCLDVGISPYTTERDTLSSLKTYEYMACGLPVVSADVGELEHLITESNAGLVFEPENVEDLSQAMLHLFDSKPKRTNMGENARAYAEDHLSWQRTVEETEEVFKKLI